MTIRIEINTVGAVTALDKIAEVSRVSAMEAMSKAGSAVRDEGRKNLRQARTIWWQKYYNGKRRVEAGKRHRFGNRISHGFRGTAGELDNPDSMAAMITSYLNEKSMVMVIAGKHKAFRPMMIKDGVIKGRGRRIDPTSKATHGILNKLETGETNKYSSNRLFHGKPTKFRARNFMSRAVSSKRGYINNMTGKTLEKLIQKQIDKVERRAA